MRRLTLAALILACACKKTRDAPPAPSAPDAAAAVVPSAEASPVSRPYIPLTFSLVTTFTPGVDARVFVLRDGIAVVSDNDVVGRRNIVTLSDEPGAVPIKLAGPMPLVRGDPVRYVAGTTDEIWFGTERAASFHAKRGAPPTKLPHRHRIVGELVPGQWVGLESHAQTNGIHEEEPQAFEVLSGEGAVPPLQPNERLHEVAFLGRGRLCGLAMVDDVQSVWWREADGKTGSQRVPPGYYPGTSRVFRGGDGECMVALTAWERFNQSIVYRVRTGLYGKPLEVPASLYDEASFAPDGSIWTRSNPGTHVTRRNIVDDRVETHAYSLPSKVQGCDVSGMLSVTARSDSDVWVVGWCEAKRVTALLSSAPARPPHAWPAP